MRLRILASVVFGGLLLSMFAISPAHAAAKTSSQPSQQRSPAVRDPTIDESRMDHDREPDRAAQAAAARRGLSVRWDPGTGLPRRVSSPSGALATITGDRGQATLTYLDDNRDVFGLSQSDTRRLVVTKTYTDGNGTTYVYVGQRDGNRRVLGSGAIATFDTDGALIAVAGRL